MLGFIFTMVHLEIGIPSGTHLNSLLEKITISGSTTGASGQIATVWWMFGCVFFVAPLNWWGKKYRRSEEDFGSCLEMDLGKNVIFFS